jgi:hypothetical protein
MQLRRPFGLIGGIVAVVLIALAVLVVPARSVHALDKLTEGYQAVLLDNNQVYYGKLSGLGTDYPVMTDVFYVQTAVNPDTKKTSSVLLKRGKEWHGPQKTMLSARHIIMVEPVGPGSAVASLIEQANRQ